jgi:hypothetical protein
MPHHLSTAVRTVVLGVLVATVPAGAARAHSRPTITIVKQTQPAGDPAQFTFHFSGKNSAGKTFDEDFTLRGGESKTFAPGAGANHAKEPYVITERGKDGWKLVALDCVADNNDGEWATDVATATARVELSPREHKTCTFTNRKLATLNVVKQTSPPGDPTLFTFHPSDGLGVANVEIAGGGTKSWTVDAGTYTLSELPTTGWTLSDVTCDDTDSTASGTTLTAVLAPGEVVTCIFSNARVATPLAPVADTPADVPAPDTPAVVAAADTPAVVPAAVTVLPARAESASARISGPSGCASRSYTVTVGASPVQSVTFYRDGRKMRTVRGAAGQRRFTLRLPRVTATVDAIRARVVFRPGATLRRRTLHAVVRRCAVAPVRPQFTG